MSIIAGESLLKKEGSSIALEFSQVYAVLSSLCSREGPTSKHIKYIIEFPPKAVEKLRQLGDVSAYAVLQKTGKYNMKKMQ